MTNSRSRLSNCCNYLTLDFTTAMLSAYQQLLQLPLFQGITAERLSQLIERYPFHFLKFAPAEMVSDENEAVEYVRFVISGKVRIVLSFRHLDVSIAQIVDSPNTLGAEHLFGRDTVLPYRVVSEDSCGILQLRKADYVEMIQHDRIFLFNILNYLSNNGQRRLGAVLNLRQGTVVERLLMLLKLVLLPGGHDVVITYRQRDLCLLLGCQRMALLRALDDLSTQGLAQCIDNQILFDDSSMCSSSEG